MAIDSLSTPINIAKLVTTSKNDSSVIERREISLELEEKIYSITKGASSSAYFNYFKNMASTNIQNANILYELNRIIPMLNFLQGYLISKLLVCLIDI